MSVQAMALHVQLARRETGRDLFRAQPCISSGILVTHRLLQLGLYLGYISDCVSFCLQLSALKLHLPFSAALALKENKGL